MHSDDISKFIVEIDAAESLDPSVVGGKAASIAELVKHEIKIPPCFTIEASAFQEFIKPIAGEITSILKKVETTSVSSAFEAAESIFEILAPQKLPVGLTESVKSRLMSMETMLAVRSSATAEDLKDASFAGIYDTFSTLRQRNQFSDGSEMYGTRITQDELFHIAINKEFFTKMVRWLYS